MLVVGGTLCSALAQARELSGELEKGNKDGPMRPSAWLESSDTAEQRLTVRKRHCRAAAYLNRPLQRTRRKRRAAERDR